MKPAFLSTILSGAAVLLAGCGSAATATPVPTQVPASQAAAAGSQAESTPEASLALPATVDPGAAIFEITGDLTLSVSPAVAEYRDLPAVARRQLFIRDPNGAYLVLFVLPEIPEPGAHILESSGREYTNTEVYVAAFTPARAEESAMFGQGVSGILTLDEAGEHISGHFEFTAQNAAGQQVTISGSFSGVPLLYG